MTESLAGYAEARAAGATIIAVAAALPFVREAIARSGTLFDHAADQPGAIRLEGRGPAFVMGALDGQHWVVRRYRRGGAVARLLGDRYLALGTPRPVGELRVSAAARARGVATPQVTAAAVYGHGPFYRGEIATRYLADSRDLAAVLFGDDHLAVKQEAARAAGRLVRHAHEAGLIHADLNVKNVLLTGSPPTAWLLDLDRSRLVEEVSPPHRLAMLARLERSMAKWESRSGSSLDPAIRYAFRSGYEEGRA